MNFVFRETAVAQWSAKTAPIRMCWPVWRHGVFPVAPQATRVCTRVWAPTARGWTRRWECKHGDTTMTLPFYHGIDTSLTMKMGLTFKNLYYIEIINYWSIINKCIRNLHLYRHVLYAFTVVKYIKKFAHNNVIKKIILQVKLWFLVINDLSF